MVIVDGGTGNSDGSDSVNSDVMVVVVMVKCSIDDTTDKNRQFTKYQYFFLFRYWLQREIVQVLICSQTSATKLYL